MVQDTPSRKLDQYIVRFPEGMRDELKFAAAQNSRSLNAEIVDRLAATFKGMTMGEVLESQNTRILEQHEMMKKLMDTINSFGDLMEVQNDRMTDMANAIRELQAVGGKKS